AKQFKYNSLFVGYVLRRNPEIVVSVLVQAGGHGSVAAGAVVRDVVKAYYDKKAKKADGPLTAEAVPPASAAPAAIIAARPKAPAKPKPAPAGVVAATDTPIGDPR